MGAQEVYKEKMEKTLSVLKQDLNTVRAGRANPALLDQIVIDYYGTPTPVKNMANIQVPDPRSILIAPFDPSTLKAIEKAIQVSDIGINPSNDGKNIRLVIPHTVSSSADLIIILWRSLKPDPLFLQTKSQGHLLFHYLILTHLACSLLVLKQFLFQQP